MQILTKSIFLVEVLSSSTESKTGTRQALCRRFWPDMPYAIRSGMINISPIGRNASTQERNEFEAYDKVRNVAFASTHRQHTDLADPSRPTMSAASLSASCRRSSPRTALRTLLVVRSHSTSSPLDGTRRMLSVTLRTMASRRSTSSATRATRVETTTRSSTTPGRSAMLSRSQRTPRPSSRNSSYLESPLRMPRAWPLDCRRT